MNEKHTPGPWIWADGNRGLFGAGPDNEVLNYAAYEGMWLGHGSHHDANARLIAAAPDLLDALQSFVDDIVPNDPLDPLWEKARAAIGKATGDAP